MSTMVNVREAKTHLSRLLQRVMNGEQIIITRAGKPVALLSPIKGASEPQTPGNDRSKVAIAADFDAPLPEFE